MSTQWSQTTRIIVAAISFVVIAFLAYEVRPMIMPLVAAGLIAYTLNLMARFISHRTPLSHRWSANLAYFLFLALVIATPGTIVPIAVRQARSFSAELQDVAREIDEFTQTPIDFLGQTIELEELWTDLLSFTTDFGSAAEGALTVVETTSVSIFWTVVVIVVTYYLLKNWPGLRRWLIGLVPQNGRADLERLIDEIDSIWRAYVQGTLVLMLIMGVVFIIVGLAIGLPGAVAIGVLTGLLSMIPELGPTIAGIVAVLVALFQGSHFLPISNFWFAVLVAGIYVVLMQVKSIWLRPQVMGRLLRMNAGLVFLAVVAAVILQGIFAALVVLPFLATFGLLGRYVRARLLYLDPWPTAPVRAGKTVAGPVGDRAAELAGPVVETMEPVTATPNPESGERQSA